MLRALSIRHFAIIDSLALEFEPGFSAITGETGAGKSILIDALGLLLGDRADSALIAPGRDQAELSAEFDLSQADEALAWLEEQAMADDQGLILRRVLSSQGQSRAWINGRTATVGQLAELGGMLVEIHGQHEHQLLERSDTQRRLLDQQLTPDLIRACRDSFERWQQAHQALTDFEAESGDPAQIELLRFQCRELEQLALASGEYEGLEQAQERLARSDEIRSAVALAATALDQDGEPSVRSLLQTAIGALERCQGFDPKLGEIVRLLSDARISIDEAIAELERQGDDEDADPAELDRINRRLEKALDLARKHRVAPAELPALFDRLGQRLASLDNQDEQRQRLKTALERANTAWVKSATALSEARSQAAESLSARVTAHLAELGMIHARLQIEVAAQADAAPSRHGRDRISIRFSANPGQPLKALSKVASGGELSRVSLALMIAARPQRGPSVRVFDEVDAGIGGETAHVVGRFLRQAAAGDERGGQAFCVTHLAQVAACADHQFQVRKQAGSDSLALAVEALDSAAREREIARMLGNADSERSLAHAREMLGQAVRGER